MSQILNSEIYVSTGTKRDCETAAQLLGLPSGDHYAEAILRRELDAIPDVSELQREISNAIVTARKRYFSKKPIKGEGQ